MASPRVFPTADCVCNGLLCAATDMSNGGRFTRKRHLKEVACGLENYSLSSPRRVHRDIPSPKKRKTTLTLASLSCGLVHRYVNRTMNCLPANLPLEIRASISCRLDLKSTCTNPARPRSIGFHSPRGPGGRRFWRQFDRRVLNRRGVDRRGVDRTGLVCRGFDCTGLDCRGFAYGG